MTTPTTEPRRVDDTVPALVRQKILSIRQRAVDQLNRGISKVQLFMPRSRRPAGFPRGELVAEYGTHNAYAYDCQKLIAWADSQLPNMGGQPPLAAAEEKKS